MNSKSKVHEPVCSDPPRAREHRKPTSDVAPSSSGLGGRRTVQGKHLEERRDQRCESSSEELRGPTPSRPAVPAVPASLSGVGGPRQALEEPSARVLVSEEGWPVRARAPGKCSADRRPSSGKPQPLGRIRSRMLIIYSFIQYLLRTPPSLRTWEWKVSKTSGLKTQTSQWSKDRLTLV